MSTTPTPDAAVRTAVGDDAEAMGAVQAQSWRTGFADQLPADVIARFDASAFADVWRQSLATPPTPIHRALVATENGRIVGLVAVAPTSEPGRGEVLTLSVEPESRRRGHGSRLLNAAVDTLRVADQREAEVWVAASDEQLRAFLQTAGLQPDGAFRDRVVDDQGSNVLREVRLIAGIIDR